MHARYALRTDHFDFSFQPDAGLVGDHPSVFDYCKVLVRELERALNRIIADMQLIGREVTLESAQELLRDLLRYCERRVTIDEIQRRVAEHFNIRLSEMTSERRARAVARPRQVAMYLAKQLTTRSLPEIGKKFGGRDHTTVMHAVRKIEELTLTDAALAEDVELLRRMLQS